MQILQEAPGSVLWLLEDNAMASSNLRLEAQARGIDPERLVFAPRVPNEDHLARHALADLFLDTFPYSAHTTASDALFMGLPMVTMMGESFASRVASSALSALQKNSTCYRTENIRSYIKKAAEFILNNTSYKNEPTKS